MGPRARRRLAWLVGIGVCVIAVGGVIYHLSDSAGHPHPSNQQETIGRMNLGIPYGASPTQVLRRLGEPTKKHAGCWVYGAHAGAVQGIFAGKWIDAVKFCFVEGVASDIRDHEVPHIVHGPCGCRNIRAPAAWITPLYLAPAVISSP